MENIRYNLGTKWNVSIQIKKNHQIFMDQQLMPLKPIVGNLSVL